MTQARLPNLGSRIYGEMEAIALERLLAEYELLADEITNGPWMADTKENIGKNWLVASFGENENGNWILTTDHVRCSDLVNNDAEADAKFCALARNILPLLVDKFRSAVDELAALKDTHADCETEISLRVLMIREKNASLQRAEMLINHIDCQLDRPAVVAKMIEDYRKEKV